MTNQVQIKLVCATFIVCVLAGVTFTGCQTPEASIMRARMTPVKISGNESGLARLEPKNASGQFLMMSTNSWGETEDMGPLTPGNNLCGNHCGFIVYNHDGAGFSPTCTNPKITVLIGGVAVPTAQYELFWRYSSLKKGCATNFSATQKTYANVLGKIYVYTVYFKTDFCPPLNTHVDILIECP